MSKKKKLKYCGRAVTWRTVAGQMRYSAEKRTALDGKVWWCIFDHKECKYIAGCRFKMRAECEGSIGRRVRGGELLTDKSDFFEDPNGFKKGKHKFAVDVHWDVARSYEVEAETREEAQRIVQERVDKGEICVWTDGFEAMDDVEVRTSGEEKNDGEITTEKGDTDMKKDLSIKRWAVTYVEYGDSVDGMARVLGLYGTPVEAHKAMKNAAEKYKQDLCLDFIEVYRDSASVGHSDECGCEYRMEEVDIPLLPTDHDVWVH